ncbi:tripartite tricarboxylate transporter TctB family protein [Candidatus Palauibacter sp.]|uniref:tripartite tricarboxylate transporter TctB family protein n=1 Tax=Candidatus Palauibacter sp. TaxID=3101350 RepID=UPI003B01D2EB
MGSPSARGATPLRLLAEAGLLAVIGAGVLLDSRGYPASLTAGAPGPAFFPRLLAVLLLACAAWLAIRAWRSARSDADAGPDSNKTRSRGNVSSGNGGQRSARPGAGPGARPGVRLGLAAGWIVAFLVAWPRLGTVLSVPLLVVGLMWLTGERSRLALVLVPVVFAGFIYLVFMVGFGVPLPSGF